MLAESSGGSSGATETFNVYGVAATPMAIADERGSTAVVTRADARTAEWLARGLTIRMGGHC